MEYPVGQVKIVAHEHTDQVLSELLGLGSREIEELRAQEVIG